MTFSKDDGAYDVVDNDEDDDNDNEDNSDDDDLDQLHNNLRQLMPSSL